MLFLFEKDMLVEEVPTDNIDKLFRMDLVQKIKDDKASSQKDEEPKMTDEKPQREKEPKKIIWIVVLAGLASFGGYFTSIKKRADGNKGEER